MRECYLIPMVETEHKDGISHHSEWKGLQMRALNQEGQKGGSSLQLLHIFHISPVSHP